MAQGGPYQQTIERDVAAILGFDAGYFQRQAVRRRSRMRSLLDGMLPAAILFVGVALTTWTPALTTGHRSGFDTIGGPAPRTVATATPVAPASGRAPWALGHERAYVRSIPSPAGGAAPVAPPSDAPAEATERPAGTEHAATRPAPDRSEPERPAEVAPHARTREAADVSAEPPARLETPTKVKAAERERAESIDALRDLRLR